MIPWQVKAAAVAFVAVLSSWGGYEFAWNKQETKYLKREAAIQADNLAAIRAQADFYDRQRFSYEAARADMLKTIRGQNEELARFRDRVGRGDQRVFVRAVCPATTETTAGAGGASGTLAELAPDARPAYFDLRAGIIQLTGRAEYFRAGWLACLTPKPINGE